MATFRQSPHRSARIRQNGRLLASLLATPLPRHRHPLIHVSHAATITDASGYVGNFVTTVESEGRIKVIEHGAVILATGADEHKPTEYLYGEDDRLLLSQLKIDYRPKRGKPERPVLARPALHALAFEHAGRRIEAPIPDDFAVLLAQLHRLRPLR